jgi:hypothetical protein
MASVRPLLTLAECQGRIHDLFWGVRGIPCGTAAAVGRGRAKGGIARCAGQFVDYWFMSARFGFTAPECP